MSQHGLEHQFHHMTVQDSRKQLSPSIGRSLQSQSTYRQGKMTYANVGETDMVGI